MADRASLDRRSWACLGVLLATTKTTAAARGLLAEIEQPAIRERARQLLGEVLQEATVTDPVTPAGNPQ
jgi:hypothetical protein